jgi:signal transduction histidine kinase
MSFFSDKEHPSRQFLARYLTVLLATLIHVFAFISLYRYVGSDMALMAVLPVIAVGWLFRRRAGLSAGFLAILLNISLYNVVGVPLLEAFTLLFRPGSVILVIVGGIVGRSRELLDQVRENTGALQREISDRKQMEKALQQVSQEAEQANAAKSELVSFVSHELRAPISAIMLSRELLATRVPGHLSEAQLSLLNAIQDNTDRMMNLVTDLMDISRIENGKLLLKLGPVSLSAALKEVMPSLRGELDRKEQKLVLDIPPALPQLWCDRSRLIQVLTNLLSNANKYSPRGGQITVSAATVVDLGSANGSTEYVRVTVQDNGMGISKKDQEQIFEKFFRSHDAQSASVPGVGLGLAIVKNLVEVQNGRIWFDSERSRGTKFHVALPAYRHGQRPPSPS